TIETDEAHVASRYGGRVSQIFAREGDALKAGQTLIRLEAPELNARRELAAAQLAELEAGSRKQEIAAARHDWEALQAELEKARSDARRAERLFQEKTISPTEREQAATRAQTLEKNAAAALSRYDLLKAGARPEEIEQAKARLAELDAQLAELNVVSPAESVLEALSVKVGDVLAANREVATLSLPSHIWVRVYVPEPWLGKIKLGEKVRVRVDSDPGVNFSGNVEQIATEAEFTPRNVQTVGERIKQVFGVKIRLNNEQGKLRAGMAADVSFPRIGG
ncbi:MAG TPA: efflux RND transporter periplasmic adaptor subunit, partial [Verrucomicrobiae bacterium]|nr:efflux RND transporter periplasmic adaptor subunit [Verrucomicrobiae bacterium]